MPYFMMNRNVSINSVLGACINFLDGVPEYAPEFMREEIEDKGGEETAAPDPAAPFDVPVASVSNTAPVVCTVETIAAVRIKVGDAVTVNIVPPKMPISGTVSAVGIDSFTVGGSDMTNEASPILGTTATITPEIPPVKT
jgi:hypothetical protein